MFEDAGLVGVRFGPKVDTFVGTEGEDNARTFGTYAYPIFARKPS